MSNGDTKLPWISTVGGVLAVGLIFSYLNPDRSDDILQAVISGVLFTGVIFGIATLLESTTSVPMRLAYRLGAVGTIAAGSWWITHIFDASLANNTLLLLLLFAAGLAVVFSVSRPHHPTMSGDTDIYRTFQNEVRDLDTGFAGWRTMLRAEWRAVLAAVHVQTSQSLEEIEKLRHEEQRRPSETEAVKAANRGAEQLQVHPTVYNSASYQESKLEADIKVKLDIFAVQIELLKLKGEVQTKIDGVIDLTTRPIKEVEKYHTKLAELYEKKSKLDSIADPALRQTMNQQFSETIDAVMKEFHGRFGLEPDKQAPFGANVG